MPFDPTVGGADANSYASVEEFDEYWAKWPFRQPEWIGTATQSDKEAMLEAATDLMDSSFDWTGVATTDAQRLCWPRSGMLNRNGRSLAVDVNPRELKDATCELAGQLGADDRMADDSAAAQDISGVTAGEVSVQFHRDSQSTTEAADIAVRLKQSEFNYLSKEIPEAVRRKLVASWFNQPGITRPFLFRAL